MVGVDLLFEARQAGLSVRADGDRLIVRGPRNAAQLAERLLAHKSEVVADLQARAELLSMAGDHGWPALAFELGRIAGNEDYWRCLARVGHPRTIALALAALKSIVPPIG